jgi:cytochrome c oxidase assembly protein subunit 15
MVEWRPIMGIVPPVGEAAWQAAFEKYQQFPEYQKINRGMSLGRVQGDLHVRVPAPRARTPDRPAVPAAARCSLPCAVGCARGLWPRLLLLFVLGGCQGLLGWYMVKSGLVDRPSVSQYRLTAHLGLAVALYAAIVWQVLAAVAA